MNLDGSAVKPNSKVKEGGNQHKTRHLQKNHEDDDHDDYDDDHDEHDDHDDHVEESGPHEVGVIEEAVSPRSTVGAPHQARIV